MNDEHNTRPNFREPREESGIDLAMIALTVIVLAPVLTILGSFMIWVLQILMGG